MIVYTTCSEYNIEFVKSIGADYVVDYNKEKFEEVVKDVDLVIDPMSYLYQDRTIQSGTVLKKVINIIQRPNNILLIKHC
jgi:NADPH:quinone reductase-like Zn-dependent oxidoreductase